MLYTSTRDNNVKVTTILFDDKYEELNKRTNIKEVKKLTNKDYFVRGTTALLDALGKSIEYMDESKAKKVMFIITTDGLENSSKKYTKEQIKEMILGHKDWEFVYIGADIDSYQEASSIGIKQRNVSNYKKDKEGIYTMFKSVSKISSMYYCDEEIDTNWKKDLENYIDDNKEKI